ncbi:hypothetical protein CPJCM30710_12950 [Clostridium polyendosporum]|uniref:BofC C-terminal domain-containing protein n=1 Tax=Clostridium polyendosporum TaxID=69208 RepID=A0A919RYJ0_9CLOT|nr:hypothetical protein [Clostridium polyendosporum]GIM28629.1 hypothetical protein CPJCM30710_12950 [Clostridium polyendosporum]
MKKKMVLLVLFIFLGVIVFFTSYLVTSRYYDYKHKDDFQQPVYNVDGSYLKDEVKIILKTKNKGSNDFIVDKEITVKELKDTLNSKKEVKKDDIASYFATYNYKIDNIQSSQVVLTRDSITKLKSNKYYIGEFNGYFAIYKTGDDGVPFIEDPQRDVFINMRKVASYGTETRNRILNFQREFDTKDDAEESISEYN